jgi:RHS repeat-associated protein
VSGQSTVNYYFDNESRLYKVAQGSTNTLIGYDNANRRNSLTLPNGIVLTYGYDNDSRINSMSYQLGTTSVGTLSYQYDAAGRRVQMGGSLAATGFPQPMSSAAYDVANELTNWNGTTITPDTNGNILNDGVAAYTWNGRNQLISRGSTILQYDSYGRRTLNAAGNNLLYEGSNAAQELSGTTPVANRILGGIDEFFNRTDSTGASSPITDAQGSVLAVTNSSGNVAVQYSYDPFGNTTSYGGTSTSEFQYTGRENDGNGLYYYRARYYNLTFGRFISEDPIGFDGGDANLYRYVWNSPTNFFDPLGEVGVVVSVGGAVEGGLVAVGAGAQGAMGFGGFVNGNNGSPAVGGFASGGAFAGGPGWGASAPSEPGNGNWVFGAYAGGGASVWVSNANNVCDLSGPFKTYSVNAAWGWRALTIQYSVGTNAAGKTIRVLNYGGPLPYLPVTGGGYGVSVSGYNTNTVTTGRGCGCK